MDTTIIVALITLVGTVFSGFIAAKVSSSKTVYRIDQLEKKVDKHNNLIERTYALEREVSVLKNEMHHIEEV